MKQGPWIITVLQMLFIDRKQGQWIIAVLQLLFIVPALCLDTVVDVFEAKSARAIYKAQIGSIWEPEAPAGSDFYVLGQFAHNNGSNPVGDKHLFVGRSVNGSLAEPVELYGKWQMLEDKLYIWSMRCPEGYVSLGSVGAPNATQPDKSKYRCVKREATSVAYRKGVLYSSGDGHKLSTITSHSGWQSEFYILTYPMVTNYKIRAYTLKWWNVVTKTKRIAVAATSTTQTSTTTSSTNTPASRKPPIVQEKNMELKIAIAFIVGSALLVIIVLVCCVRYRRQIMKVAPSSANTTTVTTTTGSEYEIARFVGSGRRERPENPEAEVKENILYGESHWERETKDNVLYTSGESDYAFARDMNPYSMADSPNHDYENIYAVPGMA